MAIVTSFAHTTTYSAGAPIILALMMSMYHFVNFLGYFISHFIRPGVCIFFNKFLNLK